MEDSPRPARLIRFEAFRADLQSGELFKNGQKVKLSGQPFEVLAMLLARPEELVSREELRKKLWPQDTFVDFDHSLNTAINKIREALGDSAENPHFVETLPRRGYRFIALVEPVAPVSSPATAAVGTPPLQAAGVLQAQPPNGPLPPRTGSFASRAFAALIRGVEDEHRARLRWRILAAVGIATTVLALLFGLNVAGLRDKVLTAVGARHGVPLPKIESIAVLPLENLSRDKEQEYFADGMTEELITNLGKIRSLRVISRTTAMHYKGTKKTLPEIARELHVDAVVEGSVLRSGNRVRITANLLHAPTDRHLWADTYERDLRDVLVLQGELARAIAEEVRIKLTPEEQARLATTRPVNPEAYQLYLKGRHLADTDVGGESYLKAVEYLEEAIQKDPGYPPTYATLAACYDYLALMEVLPVRETQQRARALVLKALELDNSYAEAHTDLGEVKLLADWDWSGGLTELRRAVDLDPGNSHVLSHYGWGLTLVRRFDEGIPFLERAIQLDPLSFANQVLAWALFHAHRDEQAVQQYQKRIHLDLSMVGSYLELGWVYEATGRNDEAISAYLQGATLSGDSADKVEALRDAYRAGGLRGYWKKNLEYLEEYAKHERVSPVDRAIMYTHAGEKEQAFRYLEKAFQQHAPGLAFLNVDRNYDPLRSDPRFQDLLRRMNFPP